MPRTEPTGLAAALKTDNRFAPIVLLDIELYTGTRYFWSDFAITTTAKIGGASQSYSPWLKSAGPFRRSKSLKTDAFDIVVQNISGNLIDRDVMKAMKDAEFEGSLAILRVMLPLHLIVIDEFHGTLSDQGATELEASFRHLQLMDFAQRQLPDDDFSNKCTWRYKGKGCGSTGSATSCPKTLTACQDATRLAQERFNGITLVAPATISPATQGTGWLENKYGDGGSDDGIHKMYRDFVP